MKKKNNQSESEEEKELSRAYINSFLSPEYDDHIPIVGWDELEKLYGKEDIDKQKKHVEDQKRK